MITFWRHFTQLSLFDNIFFQTETEMFPFKTKNKMISSEEKEKIAWISSYYSSICGLIPCNCCHFSVISRHSIFCHEYLISYRNTEDLYADSILDPAGLKDWQRTLGIIYVCAHACSCGAQLGWTWLDGGPAARSRSQPKHRQAAVTPCTLRRTEAARRAATTPQRRER